MHVCSSRTDRSLQLIYRVHQTRPLKYTNNLGELVGTAGFYCSAGMCELPGKYMHDFIVTSR